MRDATELETTALGEIHRGARGVERIDELVEHRIEKRGKVLGTDGGHDDRERAREALVGTPELGEHALHLAVMEILLLNIPDRHEHALVVDPERLRRLDGPGSDPHGDERTIAQLENELAFGSTDRERQAMTGRPLERRREEQVLDVLAHDVLAPIAYKLDQSLIHMKNGSIEQTYGDRIARDLDQPGDLRPLFPVKGFHRHHHRQSVRKKPPKRL